MAMFGSGRGGDVWAAAAPIPESALSTDSMKKSLRPNASCCSIVVRFKTAMYGAVYDEPKRLATIAFAVKPWPCAYAVCSIWRMLQT